MINENDAAFLSRMLIILFSPLVDNREDEDSYPEFVHLRMLSSCLAVDWSTLMIENGNGRVLDSQALQDCSKFLGRAMGRTRDRNATNWGMLMYFHLMLVKMYGATEEDLRDVIEYYVKHISQTSHEMTKHSNCLDQFILAINRIRTVVVVNPSSTTQDKSIHLHNFRASCKPRNAKIPYYAVRLESVCTVIQKVLGLHISVQEIKDEISTKPEHFIKGKAHFYDLSKQAWPITKLLVDVATGQHLPPVPLQEDELLDGMLTGQLDCLYIKQEYYYHVVRSVDASHDSSINYHEITIKSSSTGKEYNFFECVVLSEPEVWYGYRALSYCSMADYCGATNDYLCGKPGQQMLFDTDVLAAQQAVGAPDVQEVYHPETIAKYYSDKFPDPDKLCPVLLHPPFKFRNAPGDNHLPKPIGNDLPDPDDPFQVPSPLGSMRQESKLTPKNNKKSSEVTSSDYGQQQGSGNSRRYSSPVRQPVLGSNPVGASRASAAVSEDDSPPMRRKIARHKKRTPFVDDEAEDSQESLECSEELTPNSEDKAFIDDEDMEELASMAQAQIYSEFGGDQDDNGIWPELESPALSPIFDMEM